jgi:uncharacterized membrane protein
MDNKKWYLSKTVWAGIITALVGAAQAIGLQFGFDLLANPIAGIVLTILGALGVYGRTTASTVIAK